MNLRFYQNLFNEGVVGSVSRFCRQISQSLKGCGSLGFVAICTNLLQFVDLARADLLVVDAQNVDRILSIKKTLKLEG